MSKNPKSRQDSTTNPTSPVTITPLPTNEGEKEKKPTKVEIATTIIAASAVFVSLYLGYANWNLNHKVYELTKSKTVLENDLTAANLEILKNAEEDRKLTHQMRLAANSVDIHQRFEIVKDFDLVRWVNKPLNGTYITKVFQAMKEWLPTTADEIGNHNLMERSNDGKRFHALVVFRVRNRSKVLAKGVVLKMRAGVVTDTENSNLPIWRLNCDGWETEQLDLGDLEPGQEKYIPVSHIVGYRNCVGLTYVPESLHWTNTITKVRESEKASKMLDYEQWQAEGLLYISQ